MKTMTAKYAGRCAACGGAIERGSTINFYGRGRAEHADCGGESGGYDDDGAAGLERGTLASDRRSARNGLSVIL